MCEETKSPGDNNTDRRCCNKEEAEGDKSQVDHEADVEEGEVADRRQQRSVGADQG